MRGLEFALSDRWLRYFGRDRQRHVPFCWKRES
jgi:hypothetical protein